MYLDVHRPWFSSIIIRVVMFVCVCGGILQCVKVMNSISQAEGMLALAANTQLYMLPTITFA